METTQSIAKTSAGAPAKPTPQSSPMDCVSYEIIKFSLRDRSSTAAADDAAVEEGSETEPRTYRIVLSTETPIDRGYARLTWLHEKSAIDMSYAKNGLSLLVEHGASSSDQLYNNIVDPALHVGIIENLELVDKRFEGDMRFTDSALAQQIERDVQNRTRRFISIANVKKKWKLTKAATTPDELDEYLVTRWMPVEGSIVSIPANPAAVIKNSAGAQEYPVELETDTPEPEVLKMLNDKLTPGAPAPTGPAVADPPSNLERHSASASRAEIDAAVTSRNAHIADIVKLCNDQGCSVRAEEFIRSGVTVQEAALEILKHKATNGEIRGVSQELRESMALKDRKRWSLRRALDQLCRRATNEGDFTGVEADVHSFIEKRAVEAGIQRHGGLGIMMPTNIVDGLERHAMVSNQVTKGSELVFDQPGPMIDLLRNQSVAQKMGATVLGDLVGNIPFPKQTGDVVVLFPGENPAAAVAENDVTMGTVTLQGKTMQGATRISRQLLRIASYDADSLVQNSFVAGHALAFDRQAFHGTGAGGQCTGIYTAPDVAAIACGGVSPTWQKILDHISAVGTANAHAGKVGFVTTVGMAAKLKNVLKASAAGAAFIWEGRIDNGSIDGYLAAASNQLSSTLGAGLNEHAFIFGNWEEVVFGLWGGLEVIVDPYTAAGQGMVKFTSFQMGDVILKHGQSFAKATAATLS